MPVLRHLIADLVEYPRHDQRIVEVAATHLDPPTRGHGDAGSVAGDTVWAEDCDMGETEDPLRKYGLEHFDVDEENKVITITNLEDFKGLRDLVEPGVDIRSWGDEREEFWGQSFTHGPYAVVILAKDMTP